MKWPGTIKHNRLVQILFLFVLFHIFWLLFYLLSGASFLKLELLNYYFKASVINSLGFLVFCLAAYCLFPFFVSKKTVSVGPANNVPAAVASQVPY